MDAKQARKEERQGGEREARAGLEYHRMMQRQDAMTRNKARKGRKTKR